MISAFYHHQIRSLGWHTIFGNLLFSRGNSGNTYNEVVNSFFREVLDYSGIATTSAKVLDGIDIQVEIFLLPHAISRGAR